jgi:hypothetical protein
LVKPEEQDEPDKPDKPNEPLALWQMVREAHAAIALRILTGIASNGVTAAELV